MNFQQAQQYLHSFIDHELHLDRAGSSTFKLEREKNLLKVLGDPQRNLKVIHVAGSKGKGSICALTANILKESGYSVGLYTSPHIKDVRERIRILGKVQSKENTGDVFSDMISERELVDVLEAIKPFVDEANENNEFGRLSFFEVYTALALYYFQKHKVDFVILETGLGGRLDATNAADSIIAVIAPISLEHTHILGSTFGEIAEEKAAIIKDHKQKVIIANQERSAGEVIEKRCSQFNITPVCVDQYARGTLSTQTRDHQTFDLLTGNRQYEDLSLPLLGAHQRENCAVAVSVVECLMDMDYLIKPDAIHNGIKSVIWPLRFEIIQEEPVVVLDGAHDPASAKSIADLMIEIFKDKRITIIFGVSKNKNAELILKELQRITQNFIFTKSDHPRASDLPEALGVPQALDIALSKSNADDVILVTGSLFVASEARQHLLEKQLCIR